MPNAMISHRGQQIHSARDICLPIQFRLFRRLTDQCLAREVKNAVNLVSAESLIEIRRITDIAFDCGSSLYERSMSGGKVIEYDRFEPRRFQRLYRVTTNISGTAGYKNHVTAIFRK
jgi:hypothetical protein